MEQKVETIGKEHHLKIWPQYFGAVESGDKLHEIRVNDRNYDEGDILYLEEWDPESRKYTGNATTRIVSHITRFSEMSHNMLQIMGLNPCFPKVKQIVVMSIKPLQ